MLWSKGSLELDGQSRFLSDLSKLYILDKNDTLTKLGVGDGGAQGTLAGRQCSVQPI